MSEKSDTGMSATLMDIIIALSRIQSEVRVLERFPDRYRADGHLAHIIAATASLQEHVDAWMQLPHPDDDRRQTERRGEERRHWDRRHDVPMASSHG